MNIALINKSTNICENVAVFETIEIANEMFGEIYIITEIENGFGIGDIYRDNVWSKVEITQKLTAQEKREEAYETMLYKEDGTTALILWENVAITVDTANKKWLDYSAEGSTTANDLSALIVSAKGYIRELYPDVV